MGVEARKAPPLPAPTETDSNNGGTELESHVTDKTHYSLPEDGSPVTISTRRKDGPKKEKDGGLTSSKSQTSLLIEYFEASKSGEKESRRPSVRVKVTPSSKTKGRTGNDHIQITERKSGTRKANYTKRIQLTPNVPATDKGLDPDGDDHSIISFRSQTEESNLTSRSGGPIDIEIMPRRHGSPLIPTGDGARFVQYSDVSSMPADSFLDGPSTTTRSNEKQRSRSLSRGGAALAAGLAASELADNLKTPTRRRSRSLSRERIVAQKAVEKVRGDKSERRRRHSSRSRSVSAEQLEGIKSPRRRSSRSHHEESLVSGVDSSVVDSKVSRRSEYSYKSGTSKSSINNPKLLETVEDAIRRLILPELTALKREQSKHAQRDGRGSITSGSGISRDSREESSSVRAIERDILTESSTNPKLTLNDGDVISEGSIKSRRKERSLDGVLNSPRGSEREVSEEIVTQEDTVDKKHDHYHGLEAAAAGAGVGALTAAALHHKNLSDDSLERKERRRRRTKSANPSELTEDYEEHQSGGLMPPIPMPLMSEINASDITRSSILSADTERPHSASQEHRVTPIREVARGVASPAETPRSSQQGLGMHHSNFSRGDVTEQHVQEYELDEQGRKVPMNHSREFDQESVLSEEQEAEHSHARAAGLAGAAAGAGLAAAAARHHQQPHVEDEEVVEREHEVYEDDRPAYYRNTQEVPPPLRYVPYAHDRRGLSPIQSVSGYTDDYEPAYQRDSRLTRSTGSYSSMGPAHQPGLSARSLRSLDSNGHLPQNPHDFAEVRTGGLTDSELTQDWEEHEENGQTRGIGDTGSLNYAATPPAAAGGTVRGLAAIRAIPGYVHTPVGGVESAVASLVNPSELTADSGYSGNNNSNNYDQYDRPGSAHSYESYEDGEEAHFMSRGNSPTKRDMTQEISYHDSEYDSMSQRSSPSKPLEYDLDENGRKVAMPQYKTTHALVEKTIAANAAAAVLAAKGRRQPSREPHYPEPVYQERQEHTGAPLQKSFKERALDGEMPSPRHSVDALSDVASLKMSASGVPDLSNPMPAIGYGHGDEESEVTTNPSIIQGPGAAGTTAQEVKERRHRPSTPRQEDTVMVDRDLQDDEGLREAEENMIAAGAAAGAAAAIAHHSRQNSQDQDEEWNRTSIDRKRDTLITNPYEGTSPIAAGDMDLNPALLSQRGFDPASIGFQTGSPILAKDEGYMSSAPNPQSRNGASPEIMAKTGDAINALGNDPFYTPGHTRHISGMSHGMDSPFYDSSTGTGIDRIQSKDIVALMDHLTVRDAQRSARDTELLVTLVRTAAEMRNSFQDMKRLLYDTEDVIITEVQGNTEKSVQKAINGPRPQPPSGPRSIRQGSQDDMFEDIPSKKKNVFRRALKGLTAKSSSDLARIEEMLVQLLGEVEGLKVAQGLRDQSGIPEESYDDLQQEGNYENDRGYDPEGIAGTSTASHASQSGHLSIPRATGGQKGFNGRKFSDHRISTVHEDDEEEVKQQQELEDAIEDHFDNLNHYSTNEHLRSSDDLQDEDHLQDNSQQQNDLLQTPTRSVPRGGSVPLGTPPQMNMPPASLSNENTPYTPKTDKSKQHKHKSSSSSGWIPKVSRWSETTASTVLKNFRKSKGVENDNGTFSPPSRSGSDLAAYPDHDPYGEDKLHSGFSQDQLEEYDEHDPVLATLPVDMSGVEVDPKYKAHRNSLNLQHPQPRQGPTGRYQNHLESEAQNYNTPMSPSSLNWGSQTSLHRIPVPTAGTENQRYSNGSNISSVMSSNLSAPNPGPPRPPKESLDSPNRPPKIRVHNGKLQKPSPLSREAAIHSSMEDPAEEPYSPVSPQAAQAPRTESANPSGAPNRRPTGPRSMSSSSVGRSIITKAERESPRGLVGLSGTPMTASRDVNRDTFGTIASNHSGESETF